MVVDLTGFAFGGVAARVAWKLGVRFEPAGDSHVRFAIERASVTERSRAQASLMAAGTVVLGAVVGVILGIGIASYDYDPYSCMKLSEEEMTSALLVELPAASGQELSLGREIEGSLAPFGKPAVPCVEEDGQSVFEGRLTSNISWETADGRKVMGLSLSAPVQAGAFAAMCGIPLVVNDDLTVEVDGASTRWGDLMRQEPLLFDKLSRVTLVPEKGWLSASHIELLPDDTPEDAPVDAATIDFAAYDDALRFTKPLEELASVWPQLEAGERVETELALSCIADLAGGGSYVTARFSSLIEGTPIVFDVTIDCPRGVPSYDEETALCRAAIELTPDGLVLGEDAS